jgi:hypothetical protein
MLSEIVVTVAGVMAIVAINWWFLFSKSEQ